MGTAMTRYGQIGWRMAAIAAFVGTAALAIALPKLKEEGYSFVTVSELIDAGKPVIATSCYQEHPGDMTRIARSNVGHGSHDLFTIFSAPN